MVDLCRDLKDAVDRAVSVIRDKYLEGKWIEEPPAYLLFKEGKLMAGPSGDPRLFVKWNSNEEKAVYVTAMRMFADDHECDSFIFISEGWTSASANEKMQRAMKEGRQELDRRGYVVPETMPSESPDRVEVLSLFAKNKEGEVIARFYELKRDENNVVTSFDDFHSMDEGTGTSRFDIYDDVNLLPGFSGITLHSGVVQ